MPDSTRIIPGDSKHTRHGPISLSRFDSRFLNRFTCCHFPHCIFLLHSTEHQIPRGKFDTCYSSLVLFHLWECSTFHPRTTPHPARGHVVPHIAGVAVIPDHLNRVSFMSWESNPYDDVLSQSASRLQAS